MHPGDESAKTTNEQIDDLTKLVQNFKALIGIAIVLIGIGATAGTFVLTKYRSATDAIEAVNTLRQKKWGDEVPGPRVDGGSSGECPPGSYVVGIKTIGGIGAIILECRFLNVRKPEE
jgi:hypothetical protein